MLQPLLCYRKILFTGKDLKREIRNTYCGLQEYNIDTLSLLEWLLKETALL